LGSGVIIFGLLFIHFGCFRHEPFVGFAWQQSPQVQCFVLQLQKLAFLKLSFSLAWQLPVHEINIGCKWPARPPDINTCDICGTLHW